MSGQPLVLAALAAAVLLVPVRPARSRLRGLVSTRSERRGRRVSSRVLLVAAGSAAGGLAAGVAGGLCGALAAGFWWHRRERSRGQQAAAAIESELADALARMVEELRAGAHPAAALEGVHADGPAVERLLAPAAAAARLGDNVPAALCRVAERRAPETADPGASSVGGAPPGPLPASTSLARDLCRIAAAWALAERHGAPLAELLTGVLTDLRWRTAFGQRLRARLAGPRATAGVLTLLPLLGLGLGQLIGAAPLAVLRGGLVGQALLLAGTLLVLAGLTWSDRILLGAVPR